MPIAEKVADAIKSVGKLIPDSVKDSRFIQSTFKKGESSWLIKYSAAGKKPLAFGPTVHYSLNPLIGVGVPLAIAAAKAPQAIDGIKKDARLSDMNADEMSNMVNISRSPRIGDYEARRDPKRNTDEELKATKKKTPYELRDGGAAGDLVFALHTLKNGGA